jgi:hypothetical protein
MRLSILALAVLALLMAPMTAHAQRGRGRGYQIPPQKPAFRKAQKITPNDPKLILAQHEHFEKLKSNIEGITPGITDPNEQKTALKDSLLAVVDGSTKPAAPMVGQLSSDLANAMAARRSGSNLDTTRLVQDLKTVMNGAYITPIQVTRASNHAQTVLKAGGISPKDTQLIANDLKAIADALRAQGQPGMIK